MSNSAMDRKVRIALFGNGFAQRVMLPCLAQVEQAEVVGMASPNQERLQATARQFSIPTICADHRELLATTRPDLVFVVTPPDRHLEQTVDALGAGCHVVCEKPTALDADQSRAMLDAAIATPGQLTLIDHELRLDPKRRQIRSWIDDGSLGAIHHGTYTVLSGARRAADGRWTWWSDAARGGGTLGALGSHAIDSLRSLLGEVVAVRGQLQTFVTALADPTSGEMQKVTADDYAAGWLRFASGALATVTLSVVEPERVHRLTLAGSRGAIRLDEQGPLLASFGGAGLAPVEVDDELPPNPTLAIPDTDWARNFLRLARRTVAAIQAGEKRIDGAADFDDGHRNQLVLDAIRRSSDQAGWVELV